MAVQEEEQVFLELMTTLKRVEPELLNMKEGLWLHSLDSPHRLEAYHSTDRSRQRKCLERPGYLIPVLRSSLHRSHKLFCGSSTWALLWDFLFEKKNLEPKMRKLFIALVVHESEEKLNHLHVAGGSVDTGLGKEVSQWIREIRLPGFEMEHFDLILEADMKVICKRLVDHPWRGYRVKLGDYG